MSDEAPGPGDEGRSAPEQVADLVLYVPLGLALEARRLYPEMAARGRRQILFTRTIGKYAVRRGRQRVDDIVGTGLALVSAYLPIAGEPDEGPDGDEVETATNLAAPLAAVVDEPAEPGPDAGDLAIPDYDNLSAFQVMPRLEALDPTDLDAVREYEESTRGRRTILNKIAQLS
jgi:hypothetical protein